MRILTTLPGSTSGQVDRRPPVAAEPLAVRRAIGYMPDFFGVYEDMKVWEYPTSPPPTFRRH
jgi:ABC-2 type transport system ATP-binding protein